MTIRYDELQTGGALAFQAYADQRKRASEIMNSVAKALITERGFPEENVGFVQTEQAGEEERGRRFAEQAIQRDEKGRWNTCLRVRVDADQSGGDHLITYLFLEVHFTSSEAQLELLEDGGGSSVSVSLQPGGRDAQFESLVDRATAMVAETNDWLRTGVGKKRSIGFGPNAG